MTGRPPLAARRAPATPNRVLAIVCVAICLANLDLFIVNVALPDMAHGLGGVAEQFQRDASLLWGADLTFPTLVGVGISDLPAPRRATTMDKEAAR